jgi:hypothetical protein
VISPVAETGSGCDPLSDETPGIRGFRSFTSQSLIGDALALAAGDLLT